MHSVVRDATFVAGGAGGAGGQGETSTSGGDGGGSTRARAAWSRARRNSLESMRRRARRGSALPSQMGPGAKVAMEASLSASKPRRHEYDEPPGTWRWIRDPDEAWLPAREMERKPDGSAVYELAQSHRQRVVAPGDVGPDISRIGMLNDDIEDMVRLEDVNEPMILHNLRMRFKYDAIYTNIGSILVSVNPFRGDEAFSYSLYNVARINSYEALGAGDMPEPHIYTIANAALRNMRDERQDQSIIISGESGAGKTEATKKCLQFFAEVAKGGADGMQQRLLSANPILEAFGNAKTVRNNNSSRFGKWMEVHFDARHSICGCRIVNYLLEKSRVVTQATDERNYHIFYMLSTADDSKMADSPELRSAREQLRSRFRLDGGSDDFHFTNQSGCVSVEGMDDGELYVELAEAFQELGFGKDEQEELQQVAAGVLHLGNIGFDELEDSCRVSESCAPAVQACAELLGVDVEALERELASKVIVVQNKPLRTAQTRTQAIDSRNSVARTVYGRMFDHLVTRVNEALAITGKTANVIGNLDIFGFEIFEHNSFEQLCINFCNEKLQQHFNASVFKAEEKCYRDEGIDFSEVKFVDNQDVLDLVAGSGGLLTLLDEEVKMPRGSDLNYLAKLNKRHGTNPRYKANSPRDHSMTDKQFGVNHYAGVVVYSVVGFLEKNKDELLKNLGELLAGSSVPLIAKLFESEVGATTGAGQAAGEPGGRRRGPKTQGGQFRRQLDALMTKLNSTQPHYVRCVKPNHVKKPGIFVPSLCNQQLRYAGVFEAVKIRQQGFPFRWVYKAFFGRYHMLAKPNISDLPKYRGDWSEATFKDACRRLLGELSREDKVFEGCQFGATMVLYKAEPHRLLQARREKAMGRGAATCQRVIKGHIARAEARHLAALREALRAAIELRELEAMEEALEPAASCGRAWPEIPVGKKLLERLREERRVQLMLEAVVPDDPLNAYEAYAKALAEADAIKLETPLVAKVRQRYKSAEERIAVIAQLRAATAAYNKQGINAALAAAEPLRKQWDEFINPEDRKAAEAALAYIAEEERVVAELEASLSKGRPRNVSISAPSGDADSSQIQTALAAHEGFEMKSQRGKNVRNTAEMMVAVRSALNRGEWDAVEAAIQQGKEKGVLIPSSVAQEYHEVALVVHNRAVVIELSEAVSRGSAEGEVGELSPDSVDVEGLATAIAHAEEMDTTTEEATRLLHTARVLLRIRAALAKADWEGLDAALSAALPTTGMPVKPLADLPPVKAELERAIAESENHELVAQLEEALQSDGVGGEVGALDLSSVGVRGLERAVEVAVSASSAGALSGVARRLLTACQHCRRLRSAVKVGDWDGVRDAIDDLGKIKGGIPEAAKKEVNILRGELVNREVVKQLRAALAVGGPSGEVGELRTDGIDTTALAKALEDVEEHHIVSDHALMLKRTAQLVLRLRFALLADDWTEVATALDKQEASDEELAPESQDEIQLVFHESQNRVVLETLGVALSQGGGRWPTSVEQEAAAVASVASGAGIPMEALERRDGDPVTGAGAWIDVKAVDIELLDTALEAVEEMELQTDEARRLSRTAALVRSLRAAVKNSNWVSVGRVLEDIHSAEDRIDPLAALDIAATELEWKNWRIITLLGEAASVGGATGLLGAVVVSSVRTEALDASIRRVRSIEPTTTAAANMVAACKILSRMRAAQHVDDWDSVEVVLREFDELPSGPPPAIKAEVDFARAEVRDREVVAALREAIGSGLPSGTTGHLDLSTVQLSPLEGAIELAEEVNSNTDLARLLLWTAKIVLRLRRGIKNGDWDDVHSALSETTERKLEETAREEVQMMHDEVNNRVIVVEMSHALASGMAVGAVGKLDCGSVRTDALDSAIARATALGTRSAEAALLVRVGGIVSKMRKAQLAGDWDAVRAVVDELRDMPTIPDVAAAEVSVAIDEVDNREMVAALSDGLSRGKLTGHVGAPALGAVRVDELETGISLADSLRPKTVEAKQLHATAKMVHRLRSLACDASWEEVAKVLRDFKGAQVAPTAIEEVNRFEAEVNNRQLIRDVRDALRTGRASGVTGALDLSTIDTAQLDLVIARAAKRPPVTRRGIVLLETAKLVRRLRAALQMGNKGAVEEVLEDAEEMSRRPVAPGPEEPDDASRLGRKGCLADEALEEIQAARDEMNNLSIKRALSKALAHGGPRGATGQLDTSVIVVRELEEAIALANRLGCTTVAATELFSTAQIVWGLRVAAVSGDWAKCGELLQSQSSAYGSESIGARGGAFGARTGQGESGPLASLDAAASTEVQMYQDEVDNLTICAELTESLSTGAASGDTGDMDTSTVDLARLQAAIKLAKNLGCKTAEARQLLVTAEMIQSLRTAVVEGNWAAVERVVTDATDRSADYAHVAFPEVQAMQDEVENRTCTRKLFAAIRSGHATGAIGSLVLTTIDTSALDEAIAYTEKVGPKTPECVQLLASAKVVRSLRTALAERNWSGVDKALRRAREMSGAEGGDDDGSAAGGAASHDFASTFGGDEAASKAAVVPLHPVCRAEIVAAQDEVDNSKIVRSLKHGLQTGGPRGGVGALDLSTINLDVLDEAIAHANSLGVKTTEAARLLHTAHVMTKLRSGVLSGDWLLVARELASAMEPSAPRLADISDAEITLITDEKNDRLVVGQLVSALSTGMAAGDIGSIDTSTIDTVALAAAIERAEEIGVKSDRARALLQTAAVVRRLRVALFSEDWYGVEAALSEARERETPTETAEELRHASDAFDNHKIVSELTTALSRGGAAGQVGRQSYFTIVLAKLEAAISLAESLGCKTKEAHGLLNVARAVLALRTAQKEGDWASVAAAVRDVRGLEVPSICEAEIQAAQDEVDNRAAVVNLTEAMERGAATGSAGNLDVSTVVVSELRTAVAGAEALDNPTDEVLALLATARALMGLREVLVSDDWEAVEVMLSKAQRSPARRVASAELGLVHDECLNRRAVAALTAALSTGAATGEPGAIDVDHIELAPLASAIADAESHCKTESARALLASCQVVLALRRALASKDWDRVGLALASADKHPVVRSARHEIELARDALETREVETRLIHALTTGMAVGSVGHLDTGTLSTLLLDDAISLATSLGCKTQRTRQLLASAQIIRRLRASLLAGDWASVGDVLADATKDGVVDECLVEVRSVTDEAFTVAVTQQLSAALRGGRAGGVTGRMDTSAIDLATLDAAIAKAKELGCRTEATRQLLATAELTRALRTGLLHRDWEQVDAALATFRERGVVDLAEAEFAAAADEAANQKVLSGGLPEALATGRPSGRVGALVLADVSLEPLDKAIAEAEAVGCRTEEARRLLHSAVTIRRLRAAMLAGDWALVGRVVDEVAPQGSRLARGDGAISAECVEEVNLARAELQNRRIVRDLRAALTSGCAVPRPPQGGSGSSATALAIVGGRGGGAAAPTASPTLDTSVIRLDALDAAIAQAEDLGCATDEARQLLHTARVIRSLRASLLNDDLAGMVSVLDEARGGTLAPVVQPELTAMLREFDERAVVAELTRGISTGGPTGEPGSLVLAHVSLAEIDAAIGYALELGCRSPATQGLLFAAQVVRKLRAALVHGDWPAVSLALEMGERGAMPARSPARDELALVRDHIELRACAAHLRAALQRGAPRRDGNGLDTSCIALRDLDVAIGEALRLQRPSPAVVLLRDTAIVVRAMRAALVEGRIEALKEDHTRLMSVGASAAAAVVASGLRRAGDTGIAGGDAPRSEPARWAPEATEEVELVGRELRRREAVQRVLLDIAAASHRPVNVELLEAAVARAREIGMAESRDLHVAATVVRATELIANIAGCREALKTAAGSRHPATLDAALRLAESLGYDGPEVRALRATRDGLASLLDEAEGALAAVDGRRMAAVLAAAESAGVELGNADEMRRILALPLRQRLQLQLKAALAAHDTEGVAHTTMAIKSLFFQEQTRPFVLSDFDGLRTPDDIAATAMPHTAATMVRTYDDMLKFSPEPLHTSLTRQTAAGVVLAVRLNKAILGYTGHRTYTHPDALAQDIVAMALAHAEMRDEVYVQLMRHVRGNRDAHSVRRAWELLLLCLSSFGPSERLENYVEQFLRDQREPSATLALHRTVYLGTRVDVPSIEDVRALAAHRFVATSVMEAQRRTEGGSPKEAHGGVGDGDVDGDGRALLEDKPGDAEGRPVAPSAPQSGAAALPAPPTPAGSAGGYATPKRDAAPGAGGGGGGGSATTPGTPAPAPAPASGTTAATGNGGASESKAGSPAAATRKHTGGRPRGGGASSGMSRLAALRARQRAAAAKKAGAAT